MASVLVKRSTIGYDETISALLEQMAALLDELAAEAAG
jgi:hypothetical protein